MTQYHVSNTTLFLTLRTVKLKNVVFVYWRRLADSLQIFDGPRLKSSLQEEYQQKHDEEGRGRLGKAIGRVHLQTSCVKPRFWNLDFEEKKLFI